MKASELGHTFSPLQVGSIVDCVEPLSAGSEASWALEQLTERPELAVLPIERDGIVLGVVSRHTLENLAASSWKRFFQKDLDAYILPARRTIEATNYVDVIVAEDLGSADPEDPGWYIVQHRRSYLGIVNLRRMLEYLNELRAQDLRRAGEIQRFLLDREIPKDERFSLIFFNRMAHEIGGDFYQAAALGDKRYLIGCFDVAGKNISGALTTVALGAFFSSLRLFSHDGDPKQTTNLLNSMIGDVVPPGVFVTAILFYIDFNLGTVEIHNCGFSPVLAFVPQEGGKIAYRIARPTMQPLGVDPENTEITPQQMPIAKGLRLTVFSDGLTDMVDPSGERYGEERAIELFRNSYRKSGEELKETLKECIDKWIEDAHLSDDITLAELRFN